jgi:hypothetical protein
MNSLAMPEDDFGDLPWEDLEAAIDAFCNQTTPELGATKVSKNVTIADVQGLNVPWALFY